MAPIRTDTRITAQDLKQIADSVAGSLPNGPHPQDLLLKVSYEALIRLFGMEWMQTDHVSGRQRLLDAGPIIRNVQGISLRAASLG